MTSCFIKNPSPTTLMVCNGIGIVMGLVGVPFAAYKTTEYLFPPTAKILLKGIDKTEKTIGQLNEKIDVDLSKIKMATEPISKSVNFGTQKLGSSLMLVGNYVSDSPYRLGGVQVAIGSLFTIFGLSLNNEMYYQKKREYQSNKLIQTVCCNRIRFFMFAALGHGLCTGLSLGGLIIVSAGCLTISKGLSDKSPNNQQKHQ